VGLGLASVIFLFIQTYSLVRSSIQQGENVHSNIVKNILYSSYTNFFNRVPKGRILNRLSRDIKQLDEVVALSLSNTLLRFVQFLTGLVLMVYSSTPFVLIPAAGICILFYAVRRYFVGCFHQVIRLEKVSNSPVVTGFTTMIGGLTTIRAYRQQQHFLIKQAAVLDNNKKAMLNKLGLEHWFELVTAYLIFILNATCVGYAIFSSGGSSAGFGLLLISMVLTNEEVY
jgi:ATP-binding cassette subfamily C (CFTR/MRP) protein 1